MNNWPLGRQALVAQWIEQQFPELKAGSSNLSKGASQVLFDRGVAQLVECCVRDAEVVGSSPATPTAKAVTASIVAAFFIFHPSFFPSVMDAVH